MTLVRKEIISPGTYWHVSAETGLPQKFIATPERIRHWHDQGKAMLAAGLNVPLPLEHQPDAMPKNAAQLAADRLRNNAGEVKAYELQGDTLFGVADVQDAQIAGKIADGSIKWTSPYITSFVDGDGKEWNDVIGHLAITTRPRITKQAPFQSIAAAMSFVETVHDQKDPVPKGKGVWLSRYGKLEKKKDGKLKPAYPMAFSLLSGVRLAADEIKEAEPNQRGKEVKKAKPDEVTEPTTAKTVENPEGEIPSDSLVDPDGDISVWDVICDLMCSEGYDMPEGIADVGSDNGPELVYRMLMGKRKGDNPSPEQPGLGNNPPGGKSLPPNPRSNPIMAEQPPLYMSLTADSVAKIEDPEKRGMAEALFSLQQNAYNQAKARREDQVARILKKLPSATREKFKKQIVDMSGGAAFSMGTDGVVKDSMQQWLDLFEANLPDLPTLLKEPGAQFTVHGHPKDHTDMGESTVGPERLKEIQDELEKNTTRPHTDAPRAKAG